MVVYGALDSVVQKGLFSRLYYRVFGVPHFGSHVRFRYLKPYVSTSKGERVLDLGCGDGTLLNLMAYQYGCTGVGVDRLPERVKKAERVRDTFKINVKYHISDIYSYLNSMRFDKFDKIFLTEVLEHVIEPVAVITAVARLLEKDGQIFVTVPAIRESSRNSLSPTAFSYGQDRHIRDGLSYLQIQELAHKANLKLLTTTVTFGPQKQKLWEISDRIRRRSQLAYAFVLPCMRALAKLESWVPIDRAYGFLIVLNNK